jgi:hypothetical protein
MTMERNRFKRILGTGMLAVCVASALPQPGWAQPAKRGTVAVPAEVPVSALEPDAERTKEALSNLFQKYPPALRNVLALDPSLLENEVYLQPYPALAAFLNEHPEVGHNPSFYIGEAWLPRGNRDAATEIMENVLAGLAAFAGVGLAIGLLVWLIRTLVDYRRWSRLAKVQTEVHTKLLDRFTANEDLIAYMRTPAGAKFLESSPIALDAAPRNVGAPMGRILWSVQGGVVLVAAGIGLQFVSAQVASDASQSLRALGVIAIALGLGFIVSAIISFVISRRLGLIEAAVAVPRTELPSA